MTNTVNLPVIETIKAAWGKVKGAKGVLWGVIGTLIAIGIVLGVLSQLAQSAGSTSVTTLLQIISFIVQTLVIWSAIYIGIQRALELPIRYGMITYSLNIQVILYMVGLYILRFLILLPFSILMGLSFILIKLNDNGSFLLLGIVLSIISFIGLLFLAFRMYLGQALILDKKINPWKAIKVSFKMTRCHVWSLLGIVVLCILILLISIIPLGIGLIWTLPFMFIAYGEIYKKLGSLQQDALTSL